MWRLANKSKKLQNLYYVGASTVPGIGLPMCLISAELVYKRITGIKRGGPVQSIEEIV
jgi:phytoene dehydrogenase-like protein